MSQNQSTVERSESAQYRKSGRSGGSNQQRQFSGSGSVKGSGGSSAPSNRSSKKYNNTQGGQSGARSPNVSSDASAPSAARGVQNGSHQQQPAHGGSNAPVVTTTTNVKTTDGSTQKVTRAVPRAPSSNVSTAISSSNVSTANSDSRSPATPAKAPVDASKSFPLQFGSISPGFMNGMQVPARTSSAPPNLDEQKRDQARRDSLKAASVISTPVLEQQMPKKEAGVLEQPNTVAAVPASKLKRDVQVSAAPPVTQIHKPSGHPVPRMPVPMLFHQPQIPVQFGDPNPQMQSQAVSGMSMPMPMSLPMPMPLPMGNQPVQRPMFVSGLQSHPLQTPGVMHQGQVNFSSQMSQLPPQLGNMGINMAPQFQPQQAGKFSGTRKTVKITHPETHEELRLDGASAPRPHPASHSLNFYPNTYNANSLYFTAPSSVPLNSNQLPPTSQSPWFSNQVTVKPPGGSHVENDTVTSTMSSSSIGKGESSRQRQKGEDSVRSQRKVEPSSSSSLQQHKPILGTSSTTASVVSKHPVRVSGPITEEAETFNTSAHDSIPTAVSDSISTSLGEEEKSKVGVIPDTGDDRKLGNGGMKDKVGMQSSTISGLSSQLPEPEPSEGKASSARSSVMLETAKNSLSTTISTAAEASEFRSDNAAEGTQNFVTESANGRQEKPETGDKFVQGDLISSESSKPDSYKLETPLKSVSSESSETISKMEKGSSREVSFSRHDADLLESSEKEQEVSSGLSLDDVRVTDSLVPSTSISDGRIAECSAKVTALSAQHDKTSASDASLEVPDSMDTKKVTGSSSDVLAQGSEPDSVSPPSERVIKSGNGGNGNIDSGLVSSQSGIKEKVLPEQNAAKSNIPPSKKKQKDFFRKAEAAGTSSDLYIAFKGPEEKKETVTSAESGESTSSTNVKKKTDNVTQDDAISCGRPAQSKAEPDDWEDAADISTPKLETSTDENQVNDRDGFGLMTKKYSRDFLLKFVEQCTDLPEGFEISPDLAEALTISLANDSREPYPSPGRNDRPTGGSRLDRRGIGMDDDRWSRFPGPYVSGRGDMRMDLGYASNVMGFRPGQGVNFGVLRNPRVQTPMQYTGGILSGPMQSLPPHGGLQRNNSDSDRWQRGTAFPKGLMPSPQTPMQVMHKAERKYEIGKVADEEEAKQRQLKAILNKLTPQNFEKLFEQVKQVNIDNVVTLSGVIAQIFDKALMEPTFCEMYANFCFHLAAELRDLSVNNERITFKRLLLNKCQEEFERGEREEEEANKAEGEGEATQSEGEREEKRLKARRRMLGNIRLIGELYKKRMLTEKIMHECIRKLLGQYQNPDEENVEALCKLMSTIGEMIDHPKAKEHMDAYFDIMAQLSNNMKLSSRVRFMLRDAIDLRKNKWQQRRKIEGPKKIEEVHRDAAQERQAQSSRLSRAPSIGTPGRRGPMEFAPRGPGMLSSPSSQIGGYRAVSPQLRSYGPQDVRLEERHSYENRMSVPLPQRPVGDDTVTLGPQGGLARGMSFRGQPSAPGISLADMAGSGDPRRMGPGLNGFNSMSERTAYGQREDHMSRYMPDRFTGPSIYDQSHPQEQNMTHGSRDDVSKDRGLDRSLPASPPRRGGPTYSMPNVSSEKALDEEHLRDKAIYAVKEFYSAKDENEVALCIKDLNAPSFYPMMISVWVTDSFERKDMERDLLTNLLINLTKPRSGMISQDQLIKGFEIVLATLEDAVNDAPRAGEFLGGIFAKVIMENVVSFSEIGKLIYEGGEEKGSLVEVGLAAEVLGSLLEIIKNEKGDSVVNEIRSKSNVRLENFRPPGSSRSLRIDKFI